MHVPDDQTPDSRETPEAPANSAPEDVAETPEPRPQPKSAYELPSKKNTVLRNMIWALVLTMAVVVVIAIAFFGVGSDPGREPLANSELDVSESAERAQDAVSFPVAAPNPQEGWTERSARFTGGESPQWTVEYTSPSDQLVTLTEAAEVGAPMLSSALPGATVQEELSIGGAQCQVLSGDTDGTTELALSCQGEDFGLLVHGATDREEIQALMEQALADVQE
ncbi:DUF4245 domain-containing protein [Brachybacterium fresconis]|uniref:DUF4245 domain-containing protein n=1 Tax=Brachybacterium fresconis TaxID=173363 RepID=A0ABS4YJ81_9MICO|nr:DUF4245 domain-containing protein [Brachybacterium fresconis]MBP2408477.1 hypothetical protein [Brachybacterium fresconis]